MYLRPDEERILNGEEGESRRKAMELLLALGKIYGAENTVAITSAHLSGASYKTIGEGGLKYLEDQVKGGASVTIPSTLNPVGMDLRRWNEMHISPEFASKQKRIVELYGKMGIMTTCSCTPYVGPNLPKFGDHVAWAESSALSYVNSFIGARTNREGGPGALAAAILGRTANYGLHLDENRVPGVVIEADIDVRFQLLPSGTGRGSKSAGKYLISKDCAEPERRKRKPFLRPWRHRIGGHGMPRIARSKTTTFRYRNDPHRKRN